MTTAEIVAVAVVIVACIWDVATSRIPNVLTFTAVGLALAFHAVAGAGAPYAARGLLAGLVVFFPMFALGAMGAGDVKLMAALGAWIGWKAVLFVALYGSLAGGAIAILIGMRRRYLRKALSNLRLLATYWWVEGVKPFPALTLEAKDSQRLPYALAIAAGLAVTVWR
jgi:prepilin peptidase CpaA